MSYRRLGILLILLFHLFHKESSIAQSIYEFPVQQGQYFILQSAINPSTSGLFAHTECFAGNYSNLGTFKNIRTLSFLLNHRLGTSSDSNYHTIGLYLLSDKEGAFIQRNRAYPSYSYHIRLNNSYYFSTGLSLGLVNLSAEGTATTAGGSDITPDGNMGISIHSEKVVLGISSNQIFNSKLQPIKQQLILKRHYTLFFKRSFTLSPFVKFIPMVQLRYPSFPLPYDLDLTGLILLQDKVYAGVTYKIKNRMIFNLGFDLPVIRDNHLTLFFSYHTASFIQNSTLQAIEVNLGYLIK